MRIVSTLALMFVVGTATSVEYISTQAAAAGGQVAYVLSDGASAETSAARSVVLLGLARCLVEKDRAAAQKVVLEIDSRKAAKFFQSGSFQNCMQATDEDLLSNAALKSFEIVFGVAEVLLVDTAGDTKPLSLEQLPALHAGGPGMPGDRGWKPSKKIVYTIPLSAIGECIVRRDPIGSVALIRAVTGPERDKVLQALHPAIEGCAGPGINILSNSDVVQGTVAVNYYRLLSAENHKPA